MIKGYFKPKGVSSYDVIRELKRKYPGEKIGHGGTLDPEAEGVLVIAVGREFTKKLHEVLHNVDKTYLAEIELGKISETGDSEGPIKNVVFDKMPNTDEVYDTLISFKGKIEQIPPKYSAIKIGGKSAYKRARSGEKFEMEPKKVFVKSIELVSYKFPIIEVDMTVSSGFYVRSFAFDIGSKLGTGAYLKKLKRVSVGNFLLDDCEHIL